jgi:hypothetical protein
MTFPCLPMFFVTLVQLLLLDSAPEVISFAASLTRELRLLPPFEHYTAPKAIRRGRDSTVEALQQMCSVYNF